MKKEDFFAELKLLNNQIEKMQNDKVKLIKEFMKPVEEVCEIIYQIWEKEQVDILNKIRKISKYHNFKLRMHHELSEYSLLSRVENCFPIHDNGGSSISNLNYITHTWEFQSKSTPEILEIEINPIDANARYPVDCDDNPSQFTYRLPTVIHQKFVENTKDKINVITDYFHQKVNQELESIDLLIKKEVEKIKINMESIDFSNPQVREQLAKKLKEF